MLYVRVGLPLNDFFNVKSGCSQEAHHLLGTEGVEVQHDRLSHPFRCSMSFSRMPSAASVASILPVLDVIGYSGLIGRMV